MDMYSISTHTFSDGAMVCQEIIGVAESFHLSKLYVQRGKLKRQPSSSIRLEGYPAATLKRAQA